MRNRTAAAVPMRGVALALSVIVAAALVVISTTRALYGHSHGPANSHVVHAIGSAPDVVVPAGEGVTYTRTPSDARIGPGNDALFEQDWQLGPRTTSR